MTPIVAFTKDWDDVPTATTHVLRMVGRDRPVLWINSVGARKPNLGSGRDLKRLVRKGFAALNQRFVHRENQVHSLAPLVIPMPRTALARRLNRCFLGRAIKRELKRQRLGQPEVWAFVPSAGDYLGCFGERQVLYYCVDDWSTMPGLDHAWISACERRLLAGASVVVATSRKLVEKCQALTAAPVHYLPHGVEHAKFARALAPNLAVPPALAKLPRPRLGFYGTIAPHLDLPLLESLARKRRDWTFVLIGPVRMELGALAALPNVVLPGRVEHDDLPAWCKGFDLALIPYDAASPFIQAVNPVKARELLAAGLPIVATAVPELQRGLPHVTIADDAAGWEAAIEGLLAAPPDRAAVSASVLVDDWSARVDQLRRWLDEASPHLPERPS